MSDGEGMPTEGQWLEGNYPSAWERWVAEWVADFADRLAADMDAEPELCALCGGLGFRKGVSGVVSCPECGGSGYEEHG